ncbi:MAG: hypothetical protein KC417_01995, partial [Myxococcales bacterium]|nr:hypothetical protein [Myxococcales bacterium]
MADSPSNPKKIKDLKARLGRTVAPGGSSPGSLQPPGAPPTSVRPPSMRPSSPGGYPAPTPSVPAPVAGV